MYPHLYTVILRCNTVGSHNLHLHLVIEIYRIVFGFKIIDRRNTRHGYQIASPEGDIIGQVTSGTMSPCLKQGIGMGYVKKEFAKVGTQIAIVIREKLMKAEVVKLPFIQQK